MLNKINRLNRNQDYQRIFRNSKPISSGNLTIRVCKGDMARPSRFGFIVSNKIDKRATVRNSLRRRLRALAAQYLSAIGSGYNIVVIVHKNYPLPHDFSLIKKDFDDLLWKTVLKK